MSRETHIMHPVSLQPPLAASGVTIDDAMATPPPPANAKPVHVLISPFVPVDGSSAAVATQLQACTGVLYLDHHRLASMARNELVDDPNKKRETWLQEMRGWLMLLATLAASVTYQAGLNPPGGFWQADDDKGHVAGTPVLESNFAKRYTVFFYFNATAFVMSVVIIILLMNESFYHAEAKVEALELIVVIDMAALMGAYISGSTREVSSSIYIIVLAVVVFLYVIYTAQFLPKLWRVLLQVPCFQEAAEDGTMSVPQEVLHPAPATPQLESANNNIFRTKSAPAPAP